MVKFLLAFVVLIHGLIHLLGFLKEWKLARVSQLTGETLFPLGGVLSKLVGVLWLLTCLFFAVSSAGLFAGKDWWWMPGCCAIAFSQALIVVYWEDAKAGTILNVLLLPVLLLSYADWKFEKSAQQDVKVILESSESSRGTIVKASNLDGLPPCVRMWLTRVNVIGKEKILSVRLKQKGTMRQKAEGEWIPFDAEQYFTVDPPSFVWKARVRFLPLLHIAARDKYQDGRGNMLIKLLSLLLVADSKGKEIDQGAIMRYLAETAWFPTAALSKYITWETMDSTAARATVRHNDVTASGVFRFDSRGDLLSFEGLRYKETDGRYSLEPWLVTMKSYRSFDGIRIPNACDVTWKLREGDFTWFKLELTDVEYNRGEPF